MRKLTAFLTAPLLLAPALALAGSPIFDIARFDQDVKTLSSDEFEGRAPASAGEKKTIAFIEQRMKAAGLQPGGPGGKWTQDVPLLKSDIVGTPSLSLTIGGSARPLTQGEEIAVRAATNGQDRVDLKGVPLVFVGYAVKAPERGWDDFKGADLKGKIMVVLVNDPDFEGGEGDFGGKTMTYYGRWTYKYEEGARQGAAGVLVIHEYAPASYGWPTVKNSNTNTMFDIVRADPAAEHVPMEGWIQRDLAADLFKAAGLDFEAMKAAARKKDFKPVVLNATLDASYAVKAEKITSYNVLGRLPGKGHPNETVIYSAHWDHLGVGLPDAKGDRIYNGAKDNASGIAALIELGRAFAKQPRTDRSIVFLAVTAEEKGLLGSEYYGANPVYPLATTAGVINMDNILSEGKAKDYTISGVARLGLLDMLVAEGTKLGRTYVPDPRTETGGFYRSDHFPMAKQGVPAISFKPGTDLDNGGIERGKALGAAYTKDRYHQPADQWEAGWDLSNMLPDLTLLYNTGRTLADSRAWPEWSADAEFKAKRDETAAERK
ncbi:M28 family metallopeptidase [Rhizorhabdus dicambivorans]|uniref:Peptidase M20 n=1 Tax=Rhizorhabdus dicambivorans TaxID=1850238 RepID=A0A2A4G320_9SPHN|nr:M28 family metallopeptidase [Rhizorhabdus dicambivorans]ATE64888.1 peptidase M20 [Rhizorhabdus dicambivorans]PCE44163.1 peptidase M20 [Rhizorhabdus dicambivorans]